MFVFYKLTIFFRKIYSVANCWFLISIIDWSIAYRPESKTLMDLDTALNFFLVARDATKLRIGNMARSLVAAWNKKYAGTTSVSKKKSLFKKVLIYKFKKKTFFHN